MHQFPKIFEPGRLGSLDLKNRIIYSAMDLRHTDGMGHMAEGAIASVVMRAKHGPGMVCLPGAYAWMTPGVPHGKTISLAADEFIPALARVTQRIHTAGAKAMIQIAARGTRIEGSNASTGPSAMRFAYEAIIPRPLTVEEIQERVAQFGQAARRALEAGFDAIEIHASTGKLLSMFLSPYSNHRQDLYGGNTENRTRFLRESIMAMRAEVGDMPITVRLTLDDMLPGGIDQAEGLNIVRFIDPLVQGIQVSTGTQERIWNISCSYFFPKGYTLPITEAVKKVASSSIIAMAKLGEPTLAEKVLAEGQADFISLGRPLLVDPFWMEKAAQGDIQSIRRCIGCLNCFTFNDRPDIQPVQVTCTIAPELMREERFFNPAPSPAPQKILIVGGGLAGLEAARMLALRGHFVSLHEKSSELGGQWIVASKSTWKGDYKTLIPHYSRELQKLGVEIHLQSLVDEALLHKIKPDHVVLASGALPRDLPTTPYAPNTVQGNDVIMDRAHVGQRVVVIGGRYIGMEVAVKLAEQGKHVSVIDAVNIGQGTNPRILGIYRNKMVELGVYIYPHTPFLRFTPPAHNSSPGVDVVHLDSLLSLTADTVVLAIGTQPYNPLAATVRKIGLPCHVIGDAKRIGDALTAIRDGAEMGMEI